MQMRDDNDDAALVVSVGDPAVSLPPGAVGRPLRWREERLEGRSIRIDNVIVGAPALSPLPDTLRRPLRRGAE